MKSSTIKKATALAFSAHEGQYRKYGDKIPYVQHPIRVALKVSRAMQGKIIPVAAALLHDVLEDTNVEKHVIKNTCGEDVLWLVEELTNPSKLPENQKKNRAERKKIDREHIAQASHSARIIKLCDRIDNLYDLGEGAPEDFRLLYARESRLLLEALKFTDLSLEEELLAAIEEIENDRSSQS
jgi:guanosine-3',5'-bis(diphosphate) 3'-pyrophosphohydrolase